MHQTVFIALLSHKHFMADDYTWCDADDNYFYFASCDRSDIYVSGNNIRPDPNIRMGRIKQ